MLQPAFVDLAQLLAGADIELPYRPGTGRQTVSIEIDASDGHRGLRTLRDIRLRNEPVLVGEPGTHNRYRLSTLLNRDRETGCTGQELRALLAQQFLIPVDLLSTNYDSKRYTWLADTSFVSLDTSSPGGVSATDMEEERD